MPATAFIVNAALNDDGGIDVDDELRVNDHGVWAAGDVACYPEPHVGGRVRIEHWRLAEQLGRAAAASMAGRGAPFSAVPGFWTQQFGLRVAYVGVGRGWDATIAVGDVAGGDFTVFYAARRRARRRRRHPRPRHRRLLRAHARAAGCRGPTICAGRADAGLARLL